MMELDALQVYYRHKEVPLTPREFPIPLYFHALSIYSFLTGSKTIEILVAVKLAANKFIFLGILKTFILVFKWKILKIFFIGEEQ